MVLYPDEASRASLIGYPPSGLTILFILCTNWRAIQRSIIPVIPTIGTRAMSGRPGILNVTIFQMKLMTPAISSRILN